jgi:ABC-2 type transport system ATP-binding protein
MAAAIETHALTRRFGRTDAVNGLTMQVPEGGIFALIGPNGAGKTTTIKMLMNLLRPSSGAARVLGVDARRLDVREFQRIGYVSENQQLPDWMTPGQLLRYCRPFYPGRAASSFQLPASSFQLPAGGWQLATGSSFSVAQGLDCCS